MPPAVGIVIGTRVPISLTGPVGGALSRVVPRGVARFNINQTSGKVHDRRNSDLPFGSSNIKFALFEANSTSEFLKVLGKIRGVGTQPEFSVEGEHGHPIQADGLVQIKPDASNDALIEKLLDWIDLHDEGFRLVMAGHRVVRGGQTFTEPAEITPTVMTEMDGLTPLAPMHQLHSIAAVQAVSGAKPELRQIACFDTSFHPTQPRVAQLYALPLSLSDMGILKYGFHGVSYDYIASVLRQHAPDVADGRIIVAHLGSGASM